MENRKTDVRGLAFHAAVTDLAKHQIVSALNAKDTSGGEVLFRGRTGMNLEATAGDVHYGSVYAAGNCGERRNDGRRLGFKPRFQSSLGHRYHAESNWGAKGGRENCWGWSGERDRLSETGDKMSGIGADC